MTVAHVYAVAFQGIDAREVDVQVHIGDSGGGQFNIVGLAASEPHPSGLSPL